MQKVWLYRNTVYVVFFISLVLFKAPASVFSAIVQSQLPQLWLADAQGSFWHGKTNKAIVTVDGGSVELGELRWSLKPWSLLILNPQLDIVSESSNQTLSASVAAGFGGVSFSELRGEFPLAILEPWVPLLIKGQVFFNFNVIELTDQSFENAEGSVSFRNIVWRGGDVPMPLGNYQANVQQTGDSLTIELSDQQARLGLNGRVDVESGGTYQMALTLSPLDGLDNAVAKSLVWLGKKQPGGEVLVSRKGQWK